VTHYGLDGLGINPGGGVIFFALDQTSPGAHPASYTVGTGSFLGVKWLGHGFIHTSHLVNLVSKLKEE